MRTLTAALPGILPAGTRLAPLSMPPTAVASPRDTWTPQSRQVMADIEQRQAELAGFDEDAARRRGQNIMTLTSLCCSLAATVARAALPANAALGVSLSLSIGMSVIGMMAVDQTMQGAADKTLLLVSGMCTSLLPIFAMAGPEALTRSLVGAACGLGAAAGIGYGFGSALESDHFGMTQRLDEARRLVENYEACRQQHAHLQGTLAPG